MSSDPLRKNRTNSLFYLFSCFRAHPGKAPDMKSPNIKSAFHRWFPSKSSKRAEDDSRVSQRTHVEILAEIATEVEALEAHVKKLGQRDGHRMLEVQK